MNVCGDNGRALSDPGRPRSDLGFDQAGTSAQAVVSVCVCVRACVRVGQQQQRKDAKANNTRPRKEGARRASAPVSGVAIHHARAFARTPERIPKTDPSAVFTLSLLAGAGRCTPQPSAGRQGSLPVGSPGEKTPGGGSCTHMLR